MTHLPEDLFGAARRVEVGGQVAAGDSANNGEREGDQHVERRDDHHLGLGLGEGESEDEVDNEGKGID